MSIVRAIELASRNRALKRHVQVVGDQVPIFVSPDALLKYLKVGGNSFDADPWLANLLIRNSELNEKADRSFSVLAAAIADNVGVAEFLIARRGRASNSLAEFGGGSELGGRSQNATGAGLYRARRTALGCGCPRHDHRPDGLSFLGGTREPGEGINL